MYLVMSWMDTTKVRYCCATLGEFGLMMSSLLVIYPVDYQTAGFIIDDVRAVYSPFIPADVLVVYARIASSASAHGLSVDCS